MVLLLAAGYCKIREIKVFNKLIDNIANLWLAPHGFEETYCKQEKCSINYIDNIASQGAACFYLFDGVI